MKNTPCFARALSLALFAAGLSIASSARAQSVSFIGSYTQNFDSMGTAGTTAPTGWSVFDEVGSHDTFSLFQDPTAGSPAPGVEPNLTAGTLTAEPTLTAGAATTQKGVTGYNFGTTASSTDRALGTSPSGNAATILEASFTNSTGSTLTAVALFYDMDRFTTTVNNNTQFSGSPMAAVEEFPGYVLYYSLNNGSTWTNVSALNPTLSGPGSVIVPNTVGLTHVADVNLPLSGGWVAGGSLELAWVDDNAQGPSPDQLLGLNNVTLTAIPEPPYLALVLGIAVLGFTFRRRLQLTRAG